MEVLSINCSGLNEGCGQSEGGHTNFSQSSPFVESEHGVRRGREGLAVLLNVLRQVCESRVAASDAADRLAEVPPLWTRDQSTLPLDETCSLPQTPFSPYKKTPRTMNLNEQSSSPPRTPRLDLSLREVREAPHPLMEQVYRLLQDVSHMLRESDANLLRAAEYGSSLLEDNRGTTEELLVTIAELKDANRALESHNAALSADLVLWKGSERQSDCTEHTRQGCIKVIDDLHLAKAQLHSKMAGFRSRSVALEETNERLVDEVSRLQEQLRGVTADHAAIDSINERLTKQLTGLQEQMADECPSSPIGSSEAALDRFLGSPSKPLSCRTCHLHEAESAGRKAALTRISLSATSLSHSLGAVRDDVATLRDTMAQSAAASQPAMFSFVALREHAHLGQCLLQQARCEAEAEADACRLRAAHLEELAALRGEVARLRSSLCEAEEAGAARPDADLLRAENAQLRRRLNDKGGCDSYLQWQARSPTRLPLSPHHSVSQERRRGNTADGLRDCKAVIAACRETLREVKQAVALAVLETQEPAADILAAVQRGAPPAAELQQAEQQLLSPRAPRSSSSTQTPPHNPAAPPGSGVDTASAQPARQSPERWVILFGVLALLCTLLLQVGLASYSSC